MSTHSYRWPLALKLTLIFACLVMLVAIGLSHLAIARAKRTSREDLQQHMRTVLNMLAATSARPLSDQEIATLRTVARHLEDDPVVMSVCFLTPEGERVAGQCLCALWDAANSAASTAAPNSLELSWTPDYLQGRMAVQFGNRIVGSVSVALSTTESRTAIAVLRRQGIEAAAVAAAVAVLLALLISHTITQPLRYLVESANRLAAGGLSQRIEVRTSDELAILASAMEHMRAELQELYSNLELEVSDRTRALELRTRELSELNTIKDKFFTIVSHDLQTPISGLLELITFIPENLEHLSETELKETLDTMRASLENFYELLRNLFTWSGIQRGTIQHHPQNVDIHAVVQRNIGLLMPLAEDKHVRLKNLVPPGTAAYADPDMVYAIIRSLVSNAIKFTFAGDSVRIAAAPDDDGLLRVSVTDTGAGIRAEDVPKIFCPDEVYQTPGTAGEEGIGVGLLLCKELVEQNSGTIWVESHLGDGSTFSFTLPLPPDNHLGKETA